MTHHPLLLVLALLLLAPPSAKAMPKVVASNTILWGLTREIACDDAEVSSLTPPGVDPHGYEPSPADLVRLREASLIVINGLALEPRTERSLAAAQSRARVLTASRGIDPIGRSENGSLDPHAWQDPAEVVVYIDNISVALAAIDAAHAEQYASRARALRSSFLELKDLYAPRFAAIPREKRKMVTSHDALAYFGRAFDVEIVPLRGLNPDEEPNAREMARIIDWIRSQSVQAVFMESTSSPKLPALIGREAGVKVVTELHTDSLGLPGSDTDTTLKMLRSNLAFILAAMETK